MEKEASIFLFWEAIFLFEAQVVLDLFLIFFRIWRSLFLKIVLIKKKKSVMAVTGDFFLIQAEGLDKKSPIYNQSGGKSTGGVDFLK